MLTRDFLLHTPYGRRERCAVSILLSGGTFGNSRGDFGRSPRQARSLRRSASERSPVRPMQLRRSTVSHIEHHRPMSARFTETVESGNQGCALFCERVAGCARWTRPTTPSPIAARPTVAQLVIADPKPPRGRQPQTLISRLPLLLRPGTEARRWALELARPPTLSAARFPPSPIPAAPGRAFPPLSCAARAPGYQLDSLLLEPKPHLASAKRVGQPPLPELLPLRSRCPGCRPEAGGVQGIRYLEHWLVARCMILAT